MLTSLISFATLAIGVLTQQQQSQQPLSAPTQVTKLTTGQFADYIPYIQFARAAYCNPNKIVGWKCGHACEAIPGFQPTLTGGDGDGTQFYFVGYWPAESAVVVAHQGTDPIELQSDLTDLAIDQGELHSDLFPGVPAGVMVHTGFSAEHRKTAHPILAEVKRLMKLYASKKVILTGHSLGGALSEIECMYMKLNLPADTIVKGVTFGTPRVGNAAWAAFFDEQIPDFVRINNKHDLVPIVPGRALGFLHPHGEIHVQQDGTAVTCSGDDDATDPQCTVMNTPRLSNGNILDHLGPYQGIFIGTLFCTE
ncbi:alpha/beta-hydrolase [Gloeopeniophorella convolvens]|nr:alpha/beta-hydrolase [Gloeopeniophorella convolvens]